MKNLITATALGLLTAATQVQATPWVACGTIAQMTVANGATIPGRPLTQYEYGIAYNSVEPVPIVATNWNSGYRISNKQPYLVFSDNPAAPMKMGGFVFYSGTQAADDNCGSGFWRHRYWWNDGGTISLFNAGTLSNGDYVRTGFTNGCYTSQTVYCRLR